MRRWLWMAAVGVLGGCTDVGPAVVSDDCHASCDNDVVCGGDREECISDCDDISFVVVEVGCGETAHDYFACAATTSACDGTRDATCAELAAAYESCLCRAVRCAETGD